jgi:CTP:molybdopterin cytidylyltransferase MocA
MGCILKGGGGLYSRVAVGAVLLAAGAGERMGRRPKSILELGGVPLLRRQVIALSGAGVDELVVVLGHHAERLEPLVRDFPVTVVTNPEPSAGQVSSLRVGLAALSSKLDVVIVALADQPLIGAEDIRGVIAAYKQRPAGASVVQPYRDGTPGNPVAFAATVAEDILRGEAKVGCRQWQAAHPDAVFRWETTNDRYFLDIDSEDDIARLAERTGHRLRWPPDLISGDVPT